MKTELKIKVNECIDVCCKSNITDFEDELIVNMDNLVNKELKFNDVIIFSLGF